MRWLVPTAAAVVIIGGGAAAGTLVASADPSLPDRSAAQLLADVQNAKVDGLSGTVVETADLGLPAIASAIGSSAKSGDLTRLVAGSNTARVWYAGQDKTRVALVGTDGETDVIRNGSDVWLWKSADKTATHVVTQPGEKVHPGPAGLASATPQDAAAQALAAISPSTKVTTTGAAKVAGRQAYELVLSPKDTSSLVGQVRLAIDAEKHIPLRVDVYAKNATSPAIRVAFQQISFTTPDAQQFTFNPPAGTKVTEAGGKDVVKQRAKVQEKAQARMKQEGAAKLGGASPNVIGTGWTSILTLKVPTDTAGSTKAKGKAGADPAAQMQAGLNMLPQVSGSWGKGHLLSGSLFSALVTDDGRVFLGAVTPAALEAAAAK